MLRYLLTMLTLLIAVVSSATYATDAKPDIEQLKLLVETDPQLAIQQADAYLARPLDDETRLQVLAKQCIAFMVMSNYDRVTAIYQSAELDIQKPGNESYHVQIESCYARSLERRGKIEQALSIYNKLISIAEQHDLKLQSAWVYSSRGQLFSYQGKYAKSIEDVARAFELFEQSGEDDKHFRLQLMNAMGNTYGYMKQYDRALQYYHLVDEELSQQGDIIGQSIAVYNIANTLVNMDRLEQALTFANKARALSVKGDDKLGVAYADMQIAKIESKQGDFEAALQAATSAHEVFLEYDDTEGIAKSLLNKAQYLHGMERTKEAIPFAQQAAEIYTRNNTLSGQEVSYELLAELAYNEQAYRDAYLHLKKRFELNEMIFDKDLNREVAAMEAKFNAQIQVQQNQLLQAQNEVKEAKLEQAAAHREQFRLLILALLIIATILTWQLVINRRARKLQALAARTDELTGIANRRHILELLQQEWERAVRYHETFTVVLLDVDHFKAINDKYGHSMGDKVLKAIASQLIASARVVDHVARYGGEEFIILLPKVDKRQAQGLVERVRHAIESIHIELLNETITASLGYADFDGKESLESLLSNADKAMYIAKAKGRNQSVASSTD
ncbi:diguanylate cyclase [Corallincola holothuriorum]|uniref:diguanylate cyclase n=1 Tax=Corallincola holothuriorum TaxID=2282215 RepID=A0A368NK16_9GAMM|nr:tetratricopeptide repeat-containing diguanylate cyclase [Corallincola holothuriorum]RCU50476.1 diguanylate cyclase [Corallincola holothuriorum]